MVNKNFLLHISSHSFSQCFKNRTGPAGPTADRSLDRFGPVIWTGWRSNRGRIGSPTGEPASSIDFNFFFQTTSKWHRFGVLFKKTKISRLHRCNLQTQTLPSLPAADASQPRHQRSKTDPADALRHPHRSRRQPTTRTPVTFPFSFYEVCNVLVHGKFLLWVSTWEFYFWKMKKLELNDHLIHFQGAFCCALKAMVLKAISSGCLQMIRGPPELVWTLKRWKIK